MKRVAFIMVNHDGGEETFLSARSVLEDLSENDILVLVDNGSSDGSGKRTVHQLTPIRYFSHEQNLPFSAATNIGIRWALEEGYSYIGLINPDVRVKPGMTETLVNRLKNSGKEKIGAVSPVMVFDQPANTIWFAGGNIYWLFSWLANRGINKPATQAIRFGGFTAYLTGCCWLAPASVWKMVGLLDDSYAMYVEDVDWSYRARLQGYHLMVANDALLIHRLSLSTGGGRTPFKMTYRTLASRLFFKRYTPKCLRPLQLILAWIPVLLYYLMLRLKHENEAASAFLKASLQPLQDPVKWLPE